MNQGDYQTTVSGDEFRQDFL